MDVDSEAKTNTKAMKDRKRINTKKLFYIVFLIMCLTTNLTHLSFIKHSSQKRFKILPMLKRLKDMYILLWLSNMF